MNVGMNLGMNDTEKCRVPDRDWLLLSRLLLIWMHIYDLIWLWREYDLCHECDRIQKVNISFDP